MSEVQEKTKTQPAATESKREFAWPKLAPRTMIVAGLCLLFLLAEFAYEKHPHVKFEGWFAFSAILGLIGVVAIVGIAYLARGVLGSSRDDYDV